MKKESRPRAKKESSTTPDDSFKSKICDRFRQVRMSHDLTQKELAKKLGIPRTSVATIEGYGQLVTVEMAVKLRQIYKVDLNWLFVGDEQLPGNGEIEMLRAEAARLKEQVEELKRSLVDCRLNNQALRSALDLT